MPKNIPSESSAEDAILSIEEVPPSDKESVSNATPETDISDRAEDAVLETNPPNQETTPKSLADLDSSSQLERMFFRRSERIFTEIDQAVMDMRTSFSSWRHELEIKTNELLKERQHLENERFLSWKRLSWRFAAVLMLIFLVSGTCLGVALERSFMSNRPGQHIFIPYQPALP